MSGAWIEGDWSQNKWKDQVVCRLLPVGVPDGPDECGCMVEWTTGLLVRINVPG